MGHFAGQAIYLRLQPSGTPAPRRRWLLDRLLAQADAPHRQLNWREAVLRQASLSHDHAITLANQLWATENTQSTGLARFVFLAAPIFTQASMTSVHLPQDGILALDAADAKALAIDFNRVLGTDAHRLVAAQSGRLYLLSDQPWDVRTTDPALALGADIWPYLPQGPQARELRSIGAEIEMWLFTQPLNEERLGRRQHPVTGFWLWGGGPLRPDAAAIRIELQDEDSVLAACTSPPEKGESALVVRSRCDPDDRRWDAFESEWLYPAARALRAGGAPLRLSSGAIEYNVPRFSRATRFRRLRPYWDYFNADT